MSAESVGIAFELARLLGNFGIANNIGRAVVEMLFQLPLPKVRNRRPDVAYVSFSHWPQAQRLPASNAWDVLPEIVVEVISPTDHFVEVLDKVEEYFLAGVGLVWVIHPGLQRVYAFESPTQIRVLSRNDTLDGGIVLQGFQLPLAQLFPANE